MSTMDNQNPPKQAVAVEIAAESTEQPLNPISKAKGALAEMSARVEDWVYEIRMGQTPAHLETTTWMGRIDYGFHQIREIVGRVWL
jgi:hypothetical protein